MNRLTTAAHFVETGASFTAMAAQLLVMSRWMQAEAPPYPTLTTVPLGTLRPRS